MHRKIKLIWDFRGPEAQKIADHFRIHLNESLPANSEYETGIGTLDGQHCIAYLVVPETDMISMRDMFKPHRGEYLTS